MALLQEAATNFNDANPGAEITYGGGGSGKGRTDLAEKTVDYAGSDSPYKDAEKPAEPILYFPILLGAVTISYNLSGVENLKLSPDTIAGIFQRQITKWNDPKIAADNGGVSLPDTNITVAHRSDGSGTTQNFTEWLVVAAPDVWTLKSGSTVEWPADTQAGNTNQGVAQIVQSTDGAIGYIDLSDAVAAGLKYADVKNQSGAFIEPSADSASAAGAGVEVAPDLTFHAYNSSAPDAYPITLQTYVIIYTDQTDAQKGGLVKAFLTYLLGDGQDLLTDLGYAPLSDNILQMAVAHSIRSRSADHAVAGRWEHEPPRPRAHGRHMTAVATPPTVQAPQLSGKRPVGDRVFAVVALVAGVSVLVVLALSRGRRAKRPGRSSATTPPDSSFSTRWAPNEGKFGMLAFLFGTMVTAILAVIFAVPLSIGIALFMTEVAPSSLKQPVVYVMDLLSVVPSVVFGLWGVLVLATPISHFYTNVSNVLSPIPIIGGLFAEPVNGRPSSRPE